MRSMKAALMLNKRENTLPMIYKHERKEVNVELKKEAEFFGDIVIVPYMDHYDLVVLKIVTICECGLCSIHQKHHEVRRCSFVRVDAVINGVNKVPEDRILYIGNINFHHKPLRSGKWAVTYEAIIWIFLFFVDKVPIRICKNANHTNDFFPAQRTLYVFSSIWNADNWATRGGLEKIN